MVSGWFLLLGAACCLVTGSASRGTPAAARYWRLAAIALIVLATIALLRLDEESARAIARYSYDHGWYENRRWVQAPVAAALLALAIAATWRLDRATRALGRRERVAGWFTMALIALVAMRVVSFHGADYILGAIVAGGVSAGGVMSAAALAGVVASAVVRIGRSFALPWRPQRMDAALAASCGAVIVLALLTGETALAPEQPLVGVPDVGLAAGTAMFVVGASMNSQPQQLEWALPVGAEVEQAWLYWAGEHTGRHGDASIDVDGQSFGGVAVGGPTYFYTWFDRVNASAFRADVTHLVGGASGALSVGGLDFNVASNGVGLVILYVAPGAPTHFELREGLDLAFGGFDPPRDAVANQVFQFTPSPEPRTATLSLMVSAVDALESGKLRPSVIEVECGGRTYEFLDRLGLSGGGWELLQMQIAVPAGTSALTVRLISEDRTGANLSPASFAWVFAGLQLPSP
jgi:hypothetical protein